MQMYATCSVLSAQCSELVMVGTAVSGEMKVINTGRKGYAVDSHCLLLAFPQITLQVVIGYNITAADGVGGYEWLYNCTTLRFL